MGNIGSFLKSRDSFTMRLTFSYEGTDVRLISQQSIRMVPPPSESLRAEEGQTGFWYEVHDARGRTLYRRVTQNPIKSAVEVRSTDPDRPLNWQVVDEPRGTFVLLIPDLDPALAVVLFSDPLEPGSPSGLAKEIARFDLKQGSIDKE